MHLLSSVIESTTVGNDDASTTAMVQALEWVQHRSLPTREEEQHEAIPFSTLFSAECFSSAIKHGRDTKVLDWLYSRFSPWQPSDDDVRTATMRGSVGTLDWLVERVQYTPTQDMMPRYASWAVIGGHLSVLKWWHQHGCFFRNQQLLLLAQKAAADGKCDLFEWCVSHDGGRAAKPIIQLHPVVDIASYCGQVAIMDCWREWCPQQGVSGTLHGVSGQYTIAAMDDASALGKVESLEWWHRSWFSHGLPSMFTANAITMDRSPLTVDRVLSWWVRSGLLAHFEGTTVPAMAELPSHGCVNWLYRLSKAGLTLTVGATQIVDASSGGHVCVLRFFATLGDTIVPTSLWSAAVDDAVMGAISKHQGHVLDWWKRQGIQSSKSGNVLSELLSLIAN